MVGYAGDISVKRFLAIALLLAVGAHAQTPSDKAQSTDSRLGTVKPLNQDRNSTDISQISIEKPTKKMSSSAPVDATWCPTGCTAFGVVTHTPGGGQYQTVMCGCPNKAAYESPYN
jgi:hypothetical protein